jgi:hypothetical protein
MVYSIKVLHAQLSSEDIIPFRREARVKFILL